MANGLSISTDGFVGGGSSGGGGGGPPPTITIVAPPPGSVIGPSTPITFDYQDNANFANRLPCLKIQQPDGTFKYELVHDGVNFTPDYTGTMTQTSMSPVIWQYVVTRKNGWTGMLTYYGVQPGQQLTFVPFGADTSGNPTP